MNKKGEPAAWLVDGGEYQYVSLFRESADAAASEEGGTVAPLYRSPTLTDAERSAIGVAIQCVEAAMAQRHPEEEDARDLLHKTSCTLSRLFDRMTL